MVFCHVSEDPCSGGSELWVGLGRHDDDVRNVRMFVVVLCVYFKRRDVVRVGSRLMIFICFVVNDAQCGVHGSATITPILHGLCWLY